MAARAPIAPLGRSRLRPAHCADPGPAGCPARCLFSQGCGSCSSAAHTPPADRRQGAGPLADPFQLVHQLGHILGGRVMAQPSGKVIRVHVTVPAVQVPPCCRVRVVSAVVCVVFCWPCCRRRFPGWYRTGLRSRNRRNGGSVVIGFVSGRLPPADWVYMDSMGSERLRPASI